MNGATGVAVADELTEAIHTVVVGNDNKAFILAVIVDNPA